MDERVMRAAALLGELQKEKGRVLLAIDGRCASGKTTLAGELQKLYDCNVLHMDHFFLRPQQRTPERLEQPGENVDHERFLQEVLLPIREGKAFSYRPFDCQTGQLGEEIEIKPNAINIVEGSYSCHPQLWEFYDARIFLSVDPDEQLRRIRVRNGEKAQEMFRKKWIPLEERYFAAYCIKDRCEMVIE